MSLHYALRISRRRNSQAKMPASAAARCDRRHASGHGREHEEDDGSPCAPRPPPPWAAGAAVAVQRRRWRSVRRRCWPKVQRGDSAPAEGRPARAACAGRTLASRPSRKPAEGRDGRRTVRGLNGVGRG
eukprot:scaffold18278_cov56-Phaeocystis_antarctica.AAC.1